MKKIISIFICFITILIITSCDTSKPNSENESYISKNEYENYDIGEFTINLPAAWSSSQVENGDNKIILTSVAVDEECGGSSVAVFYSSEKYSKEKIESLNQEFAVNIKQQWEKSNPEAIVNINYNVVDLTFGNKIPTSVFISSKLSDVNVEMKQFFVTTANGTYKFTFSANPDKAINICNTIISSINFK